ncbi:YIP1 family protein [Candidatus Micrarchaeota archaeon]|nr:YIP1 family protein [Candidatus Micrarchaeota archaeon]
MIDEYLEVMQKPREVFAKKKKKADFTEGLKQYAIAGAATGALAGITILFVSTAGSMMMNNLPFLANLGAAGAAAVFAGLIVLQVAISLAYGGISYAVAKLLGGKGDFTTHYYLPALFVVPVSVLSMAANIVPFAGMFLGLLVGIYSLYLTTLAYREAHGFDNLKAITTWAVPWIMGIVVMIVASAYFTLAMPV